MTRAETDSPGGPATMPRATARRVAREARRLANAAAGSAAARAYAFRATGASPDRSSPRIVLDGCAFQGGYGGITRFWDAVLAEWSRSGFARHVIVGDRSGSAPRYDGFAYRPLPRLRAHDLTSERAMLEAVCNAESADLFVSTLYSYPKHTRSLLVVHDLTPEVFGWDLGVPVWRDKQAAIARASAFSCISRHTTADLHRIYPGTASRPVSLAVPGVHASFAPSSAEDVERLRGELGLPRNYYVFVGHRDIHKNAESVFEALALRPRIPELGLLLLGGGRQLETRFSELAGDIPVRIARLDDTQLATAYSGAAGLLFPSRYEGFGLVILEAMACGCPVVTCRNSALPEAADDAAIYVPEDDPQAMARAMESVLEPETREALVRRGLAWSAGFTWERTAEALREAILGAAERR